MPNLDRVERLPDASHWVHHDEAERVTQLLTDFFAPARAAREQMNIDEPGRNLYRTLRVAESDMGVLSVVIDAPPMNLIGPELVRDLVRLLGEVESGQDVRVMVLESADPEYFVPHVDLTKVAEYTAEAAKAGGPGDASLGMVWHKLSELPVVSIAEAPRPGPRCGQRTARSPATCDSPPERTPSLDRSRSASARPRARVACSTWRGCSGGAGPMETILGADDFDAEQAERYGWINRALPDADLDAFVARLARRIASFPAEAVRSAKRVLNELTLPGAGRDPRRRRDGSAGCVTSDTAKGRTTALFTQGLQTRGHARTRPRRPRWSPVTETTDPM